MKKFIRTKKNRGMTYVELIVVISIFAIIAAISMFNYGDFQARVDIRNLASDIALKVIEAQKSALSGKLPARSFSVNWKPSYGIYFSTTSQNNADNKNFIFFTDLDNNNFYDGSSCALSTGECLTQVTITKNNTISELKVFYQDATTATPNNITINFSRPNSGASIKSSPALNANISYIQVTVTSPKGTTALVKLYPSGRVQVN